MNVYRQLRAFVRLVKFTLLMTVYLFHGTFLFAIYRKSVPRRKRLILHANWYCRAILKIFSVELICKNLLPPDEGSLLIGNHVGFIDIVCLQAIEPSVFVTSMEMRKTPVLGQLCEVAGCSYVDRKNRMNIQDELKGMIDVLKEGFRVVLYAESVSSNGEQVLPFKKTLMMSAGFAGVPIRPFVFNYRSVNGRPIEFKDRDSLCWYGPEPFLPAIWRSLQLETVSCEIEFLPLVFTAPDDDRTAVSEKIHAMVSEKYVPFVDNTK